ncbi:MAG: nucleoside kinase [Chloroflexota bacterium]
MDIEEDNRLEKEEIAYVSPRPTVEVHLPDGRVLSGARDTLVADFMRIVENPAAPIVGAIVNGELRELTYPINMDAHVQPVSMASFDGMNIYRRSLTFLMVAAFEDLFPDALLTVDHAVAAGGYYCRVEKRPQLSIEEIANLELHMREIMMQDLPIHRRKVPLEEAKAYFEAKGYDCKVRLFSYRRKDYLMLYRLGDLMDYHHGYMVPSTGYIKWFSLSKVEDTEGGFTLWFPRRDNPTEIRAPREYPKLLNTFRQYGDWLERLGIINVGYLNDALQSERAAEVILVSEALHEMYISRLAAVIASRSNHLRIILIAGPSSSGKTTFSKRLAIQLLARGISPFPLEMDNYFVDREKTPLDEDGNFDFEAFDALDHQQLEMDLKRVISGEKVQLPKFNFKSGRRETGEIVQLQPEQIVILEGIQGLNPALIPHIHPDQAFRIYVSALTQLNLDRHNRISTTDTRLIRRIVRDARDRGYSAQDTIKRWESVKRGEKKNIFPYQENADAMFNSALVYELAALKSFAEPLLRQVPYLSPEHIEAKRLLALLDWFMPIPDDLIPDNSILREFVGMSILRNFKLWHHIR